MSNSPIDNLGRKIEALALTIDQLKQIISDTKTGPAKLVSSTNSDPLISELKNLFNNFISGFKEETDKQSKSIKDIADEIKKEPSKKKSKKESDVDFRFFDEELSKITKMTKQGLMHPEEARILAKQKFQQAAQMSLTTGEAPDLGDMKLQFEYFEQEMDRLQYGRVAEFRQGMSSLAQEVDNFTKRFITAMDGANVLFDNIGTGTAEVRVELRKVLFQTQGITGETHKLQNNWQNLNNLVAETGVANQYTAYKEYVKMIGRGIKDQKTAQHILKSQLATEVQLGLEAGSLGETFAEYHHVLGLSDKSIETIGRGMQDIQRTVGLSGENFRKVIEGSDKLLNRLREAGKLTASSAKSFQLALAESKKSGVELGDTLEALADPSKMFMEGGEKQLNAIRMSLSNEDWFKLMTGKLKQEELFHAMAKGAKDFIKVIGGPQSIEDFGKLDVFRQLSLNMQAVARGYEGYVDMLRKVQVFEEVGKTQAEKLEEANNKVKEAEKAIAENKQSKLFDEKELQEELKKASANRRNLELSAANEVMTAFLDARKNAKDLDDAYKKSGFTQQQVREAYEKSAKSINEGIGSLNTSKIKQINIDFDAAMLTGESMAKAAEMLSQKQNTLQTAQAKGIDEAIKHEQALSEINARGFNRTLDLQTQVMDRFGSILLGASTFIQVLTSGLNILSDKAFSFSRIKQGFGLGKSGGGVSGFDKMLGRLGIGKQKSPLDDIIAGGKIGGKPASNAAKVAFDTYELSPVGSNLSDDVVKGADAAKDLGSTKSLFSELMGFLNSTNEKYKNVMQGLGEGFEKTLGSMADDVKKFGDVSLWKRVKESLSSTKKSLVDFSPLDSLSSAKNSVFGLFGDVKEGFQSLRGINVKTSLQGFGTGAKKVFMNSADDLVYAFSKTAPTLSNVTKVASATTRGIGTLGRGVLRVAGATTPLGAALFVAGSAMAIMTGATRAGAQAAEIFGKKQEELTEGQKYAAEGAGAAVMFFDSILFGLPSLLLGQEFIDGLVKKLALFFDKFKVLAGIFGFIVELTRTVVDFLKDAVYMIWEIIKGIFDAIYFIVEDYLEGVLNIFESIGKVFGQTTESGKGFFESMRNVGKSLRDAYDYLIPFGKMIGDAFRFIGKVIGFVVKIILSMWEFVLVAIATALKPIIEIVWEIFGMAADVFKEFWAFVSPIFDMFGKEGESTFEIFDFLGNALKDITNKFLGIAKIVGHFVGMFLQVFLSPLIAGIKLIIHFVKFFLDLAKGIKNFSSTEILNAFGNLINGIFGSFKSWLDKLVDSGWKMLEAIQDFINDPSGTKREAAKKEYLKAGLNEKGEFEVSPVQKNIMDTKRSFAQEIEDAIKKSGGDQKKITEERTKFVEASMKAEKTIKDPTKLLEEFGKIKNEQLKQFPAAAVVVETKTPPPIQADPTGGSGWIPPESVIAPALKVEEKSLALTGLNAPNLIPNINNSSVSPNIPSATNEPSKLISREKTTTKPVTTSMYSPEMEKIRKENEYQSDQMAKMNETLLTLVEQFQGAKSSSKSTGGAQVASNGRNVKGMPAQYFRDPVGLVSQGPGHAYLNLGPVKA